VHTEAAIDECASLLAAFHQSVYRAAFKTERILRGNGFPSQPQPEDGVSDFYPGDVFHQAAALKAALFPPEESVPARAAMMASTETETRKNMPAYQVALSFAGEQRDYVEAVSRFLRARGIAVFYDRFEAVTLWGKDGSSSSTNCSKPIPPMW
jgi:hypothetical protein